jgi:DNA-binding transcriptional LysR family regulator
MQLETERPASLARVVEGVDAAAALADMRAVDLIGENFAVALRYGQLRDDATLVARRIIELQGGLYASPVHCCTEAHALLLEIAAADAKGIAALLTGWRTCH